MGGGGRGMSPGAACAGVPAPHALDIDVALGRQSAVQQHLRIGAHKGVRDLAAVRGSIPAAPAKGRRGAKAIVVGGCAAEKRGSEAEKQGGPSRGKLLHSRRHEGVELGNTRAVNVEWSAIKAASDCCCCGRAATVTPDCSPATPVDRATKAAQRHHQAPHPYHAPSAPDH